MKMLSRVALAMLIASGFLASAHAVTFDVFKASATFTGFVTGVDPANPTRQILIPFKLNTKQLINLARGRALKDPVPASEVLAGAGDATSMASFDLNVVAAAPQKLVVFDTASSTVLATILVADISSAEVAENRVFTKFKRIGFAKADVQTTGNATNGLTDGTLQVVATLARKVPPPGEPPLPKQTNTATGVIELTDGGVAKSFFVTKSVINVTGKRLGTFTE